MEHVMIVTFDPGRIGKQYVEVEYDEGEPMTLTLTELAEALRVQAAEVAEQLAHGLPRLQHGGAI